MNEIGYYQEGDFKLRLEPARDACFRVVRRDADLEEYEDTSMKARQESLHRHMSNEITSIDIAAQCLVDYPEAPWELRMELARQCWDEARHIAALERRLNEMGARKGDFPISAYEWTVTMAIDDLAGRLATQNRTFEAGAMDVVGGTIKAWRELGDHRTAEVLDQILADEVQHVRFANRWIKKMAQQDPRTLMRVAMAIRFLAHVNEALSPKAGEVNVIGKALDDFSSRIPAVNLEDRRLAEFSDAEIEEILRQAGFRSLVSNDPPEATA
ncbi:MAG: DUF455 family protein [Thermoanaerobaculia bacterium]